MWVLITLIVLYAALFGFKLYFTKTAEHIYENYGLDIGLFQFKISFAARGKWVSKIANIRRFKLWFKIGAVLSIILVLPGLIFLCVNLSRVIVMLTNVSEKPIQTDDLIFQPVLPGVTFPWSEASFYGIR